ncbi:uncharacterized protein LOC112689799 isoform X2 [Sipha flava]|nr:uncharacterized protein LOC112689799 isoform X2 [Sipha flava]
MVHVFVDSNLLIELGLLVIVGNVNPIKRFTKRIYWSESASIFLRKKYDEYVLNFGPGKRFLKKRDIWNKISIDLFNEMRMVANWKQVQNRYKSSMRIRPRTYRYKPGNALTTAPIQSGFQKINNIEDSKPGVPENMIEVNIINNPAQVNTETQNLGTGCNMINTSVKVETSVKEEQVIVKDESIYEEEQFELIESIISRMASKFEESSLKSYAAI